MTASQKQKILKSYREEQLRTKPEYQEPKQENQKCEEQKQDIQATNATCCNSITNESS
jgi:hypothetical protein